MKDSLQKKLWESGLLEKGDSSQIEAFKKTHKKEQIQHFSAQHDKTHHKKLISFTEEEFEFLQKEAIKHNYKQLSPFLKDVMFAYLNGTFIFPENEILDDIVNTMREINNSIAQSIKYVHLSQEITIDDIQGIKEQISKLETSINSTLSSPPQLRKWIENQIKREPLFISKLLQTISIIIS